MKSTSRHRLWMLLATVAALVQPATAAESPLRHVAFTNPGIRKGPSGEVTRVQVVGNLAFVAAKAGGLQIVDISNVDQPKRIGSLPAIDSVIDVQVAGNYAYVADAGFQVIDISNPAMPKRLAAQWISGFLSDIEVSGNLAVLAVTGQALHIFDISRPETPQWLAAYSGRNGFGIFYGIAIRGNYVYIADAGLGFHVLDISNPAAPTRVFSTPSGPGLYSAVVLNGNYAYTSGHPGMQIFDIQNPTAPVMLGSVSTPVGSYDIAVSGNYAYVTGLGPLQIYDVTNPSSPINVGSYDSGSAFVSIFGNVAFIGRTVPGMDIVDISKPAIGVGRWGYHNFASSANAVAVASKYAYVADGLWGLQILDVSDPAHPLPVGDCDTPARAQDIAVSGHYAYIADASRGLQIIDVADVAHPVLIASPDLNSPASPANLNFNGNAVGIAVAGNYAYVAGTTAGLKIVDISHPATARLAASFNESSAIAVAISGRYAYVAAGSDGLVIVDVVDPTNPRLAGSLNTQGYAGGVSISGQLALIADGETGLQIIDISNPASPVLRGGYDTDQRATSVSVVENFAFVSLPSGVQVINFADPTNPQRVGSNVTTPASKTSFAGSTLYVAAGDDGLATASVKFGLPQSFTLNLPEQIYITDPPLTLNPTSNSGLPITISVASGPATLNGNQLTVTGLGQVILRFEQPGNDQYLPHIEDRGFQSVAHPPSIITRGSWGDIPPGQIVSMAVSGNYVFAGTPSYLSIIDASDPTELLPVSRVELGPVVAVAVTGNYVYAVNYDGLNVINIGNPASPQRIKTLPGFAPSAFFKNGLIARGNFLYLDNESGLNIFDITEPADPKFVAATGPGGGRALALSGDYAYSGNYRFDIFSIAEPQNPARVGGFLSDQAVGVAIYGDFVLLADGRNGLRVVNATDRANPVIENTLKWDDRYVQSVAISGDYAYVVDGENCCSMMPSLRVLDLSNAPNIQLLQTLPLQGSGQNVIISGGRVYIGHDEQWGTGGIEIFDITNPRAVTRLGGYGGDSHIREIAFAGDLAYIAHGAGGLRILDVSNPNAPRSVGFLKSLGFIWSISLAGQYACVTLETGMAIIDVSDPAKPQLTGLYDSPNSFGQVIVSGNHAFLRGENLEIIDISNRAAPRRVAMYPGFAYVMQLVGQYLYLGSSGLRILDIADPLNPRLVEQFGEFYAEDLAIVGNHAYLAYSGHIFVVDVSDPTNPRHVSSFGSGAYGYAVAASDQFAFVPTTLMDGGGWEQRFGVQIVDVSNPAMPFEVGFIHDASVGTVFFRPPYLYVTGSYPDLRILEVTPAGPALRIAELSDQLDISWSSRDILYKLQTTSLLDSPWVDVNATPALIAGRYTITVLRPVGQTFFRLVKQ